VDTPTPLLLLLLGDRVTPVLDVAEAARQRDGLAPLNEHTLLHLASSGDEFRHLVVEVDGRVNGYAFLDLSGDGAVGAECVVHPEARGRGLGRALVRAAAEHSAGRGLGIWAHGDLPAAAAVARHLNLRRARELRRMARDLVQPLPPVELPDGVTLRTFRPDADDEAWLRVNARAFASHPEQGRLDAADLRSRRGQPWFDPAGFFLAERDGALVGFHWTKVHREASPAFGEVYVVGIDPKAQGGGLGRALTLCGLHHLRDIGLHSVQLYVEADNAAAVRIYERLGFAVVGVDVQYRS
jgi:mycothiol synthase